MAKILRVAKLPKNKQARDLHEKYISIFLSPFAKYGRTVKHPRAKKLLRKALALMRYVNGELKDVRDSDTLPRDFAYELYHRVISKYNGGWLSGGLRKEIVLLNPSVDSKIPELSKADLSSVSTQRHYINMLSRLASNASHNLNRLAPRLKEEFYHHMSDANKAALTVNLCLVGVCFLLYSTLHLTGAEIAMKDSLKFAFKNSIKVAKELATH